jgi:propanediol dehydratase small subunit
MRIETIIPILLMLAGACVGFLVYLKSRKALRAYWDRRCTGKLWRARFPQAPKDDIRHFLHVFVDAFGFSDSRRLKFSPDDEILIIYRALYPERGWPDSMELETLMLMMHKEYAVDVTEAWHEGMTLGDLFRLTKRAESQPSDEPTRAVARTA